MCFSTVTQKNPPLVVIVEVEFNIILEIYRQLGCPQIQILVWEVEKNSVSVRLQFVLLIQQIFAEKKKRLFKAYYEQNTKEKGSGGRDRKILTYFLAWNNFLDEKKSCFIRHLFMSVSHWRSVHFYYFSLSFTLSGNSSKTRKAFDFVQDC